MRSAAPLLSFAFAALATPLVTAAAEAFPDLGRRSLEAPAGAAIEIEYDCVSDYCPRFSWRYSRYAGGGVTIHNNYGTVNVYGNRAGSWGSARFWPGDIPSGSGAVCSEPPCETHCDVACWLRRYKEGYCGYGCDFYRRKVWFERGERLVAYPRPVYSYSDPGYGPPAYSSYSRQGYGPRPYPYPGPRYGRCGEGGPCSLATPQYARPPAAALIPRRRFEGPRYPPNCSGPDC